MTKELLTENDVPKRLYVQCCLADVRCCVHEVGTVGDVKRAIGGLWSCLVSAHLAFLRVLACPI